MFYTIVSKLPFIESDNSKRKILKIFIIGSVLYSLLHYYLHSSPMTGIFSSLKQYIYYIMPVDFGISFFLSSNNNTDNESGENDDGQLNEYTPEQIQAIQMAQMRRTHEYQMEMQKRQMMQNESGNNNDPVNTNKSPFKKKEKEATTPDKRQSSEKEKSQEKKDQKDQKNEKDEKIKKEEQKVKKSEEGSDTCIPVYMGK